MEQTKREQLTKQGQLKEKEYKLRCLCLAEGVKRKHRSNTSSEDHGQAIFSSPPIARLQ